MKTTISILTAILLFTTAAHADLCEDYFNGSLPSVAANEAERNDHRLLKEASIFRTWGLRSMDHNAAVHEWLTCGSSVEEREHIAGDRESGVHMDFLRAYFASDAYELWGPETITKIFLIDSGEKSWGDYPEFHAKVMELLPAAITPANR